MPLLDSHHRGRGFTVIELAVTIAIIMMVGIVIAVPLTGLFRADLKTGSGSLTAAIRYLYSLSVINNQGYRLVIDIDSDEYWGEENPRGDAGCDAFLVEKEGRDAPKDPARKKRKSKKEEEEEEAATEAGFSKLKDNMLTRRRLPKRISFQGVITNHHDDRQTEGIAEIYFFPSGYIEHAYIYVGSEDRVYTIESKSLMGTAEIHRDELKKSEFFDDRT